VIEKNIVMSFVVLITLNNSIFANEADANDLKHAEVRDRFHSVKKAIGSVGAAAQKEIDIVDGFKHMFRDGKVTGQIRSMYSGYNFEYGQNTYATALGGFVKYELAEYKGVSAAVSFTGSNDIAALSQRGVKHNDELSSSAAEINIREETYLNYNYKAFNLRVGRQIIDTPLADSDDIRMITNSFEAAILTYSNEHWNLMAGKLKKWQGSDAGLENGWVDTGKDGTYFSGVSYSGKEVDASVWYYNINGEAGDGVANNSFYSDIVGHFHINKTFFLHAGVQYLQQQELDNSGVSASLYGATAELVYQGVGLNVAYNKSLKKAGKQSFSGFGGGTLFTNMDSMVLDAISADREADAWVSGISYEVGDFNMLYAYGDFEGGADSSGVNAHIIEQNFGIEYSKEDDFTLAAIYTKDNDKNNPTPNGANGGSWENFRILAAYNF